MELRAVRPEDVDAVRSLVARTVIETYGAFCPEVAEAARRDPAGFISARLTFLGGWMAARSDGGGALAVVLTEGDLLQELFVAPEAQGRGVGRLLLAVAEREIFGRGHDVARLHVAEPNAGARRFYVAHGWTATAIRTPHPRWDFAMIEMRKGRTPPDRPRPG
ncbi:GNAT family N-acetyltransferase [Caenispirillum salinarum]